MELFGKHVELIAWNISILFDDFFFFRLKSKHKKQLLSWNRVISAIDEQTQREPHSTEHFVALQVHSSLHLARVSVVAYAKWRLSFSVSECKQSGPYELLSTVRLTAAGKRITRCLFDEWKRVRKICPLARSHVER